MVRDVKVRDVKARVLRRKTLLLWLGLALALLWTVACGSSEEAAPAEEPAATDNADNTGNAESSGNDSRKSAPPRQAELPEGPPIEGFEQLMPRGVIRALDDPQFVTAGEAEIPDTAWIMGFELQGHAYAYDLNILNHHEVVNHTIGGLPVAAVW